MIREEPGEDMVTMCPRTASTSRLVLAAGAIIALRPTLLNGELITPVGEDRFTQAVVFSECGGTTTDFDSAEGFDPFLSSVENSQQCPDDPIFVNSSASQDSSIGTASLAAFGGAEYTAYAPGQTVFINVVSNFGVTFELAAPSDFSLDGELIGGGNDPGVHTRIRLTGPGGQVLFEHVLDGPFPPGDPVSQHVAETGTLAAGLYTLEARASVIDGIDQVNSNYNGQSAFDFTFGATLACPGDVNIDGTVDMRDFSVLQNNFGTAAGAGPGDGDLDSDGDVDLSDTNAFVAHFGIDCG